MSRKAIREAIIDGRRNGETPQALSARYGIPESTVYAWTLQAQNGIETGTRPSYTDDEYDLVMQLFERNPNADTRTVANKTGISYSTLRRWITTKGQVRGNRNRATHFEGIEDVQKEAVRLVCEGMSISKVSRRFGVNQRLISRWYAEATANERAEALRLHAAGWTLEAISDKTGLPIQVIMPLVPDTARIGRYRVDWGKEEVFPFEVTIEERQRAGDAYGKRGILPTNVHCVIMGRKPNGHWIIRSAKAIAVTPTAIQRVFIVRDVAIVSN